MGFYLETEQAEQFALWHTSRVPFDDREIALPDLLRFCDSFELRRGLVTTREILNAYKEVRYSNMITTVSTIRLCSQDTTALENFNKYIFEPLCIFFKTPDTSNESNKFHMLVVSIHRNEARIFGFRLNHRFKFELIPHRIRSRISQSRIYCIICNGWRIGGWGVNSSKSYAKHCV